VIVVADTSPINYLVLLGQVNVLPKLYGTVLLPTAVLMELTAPGAPSAVRSWALNSPEWIEVVEVLAPFTAEAPRLGRGESEAIEVALLRRADLLLMDDAPARKFAIGRGLIVTGTLGVLRDAADEGLLEFRESVTSLRNLGFRVSGDLIDEMLAEE
jgi:predicted nucleic acid-binding protein